MKQKTIAEIKKKKKKTTTWSRVVETGIEKKKVAFWMVESLVF